MHSRTRGASALLTILLASTLVLGATSPATAAPGEWEVVDRVSLGVGTTPTGVAVDQTTGVVYVSDELAGTVSIIDGDTLAVLGTVTLPLGSTAVWINVDQSTGLVYVVDPSNNVIRSFDPNAADIQASIVTSPDLGAPLGMIDVVEGSGVFVTQPTAGAVVMLQLDLTSPTVLLSGLATPVGVAVVDGSVLLASELSSAAVAYSFVGGVDGEIPVGDSPTGLALNHANSYLAVANSGDNTVSVISPATGLVKNTIPVDGGPLTVAFATNDSTIFSGNAGSDSVSVIPTLTSITSYSVPLGGTPTVVAFGTAANRLYTALSDTGELVVLELTAAPPATPASTLPVTGMSLELWLLVPGVLILAGALLLAVRRRAALLAD